MSSTWTIPHDIFRDVLFHLSRNEIEKCQLISIFLRNSIDSLGKVLPLRDFNSFDLMFRGDRAFLMKDPSKQSTTQSSRNSYAISTYEEIKCFQYCFIKNVRIREFDQELMETFKRIYEIFGDEKLKVRNFSILGPFVSMTHINFLPTLFQNYVYALNFNLTLRYEELLYITINPEVLRIGSPPNEFNIIDTYGNTAMFSPESEESLNIDSLVKFLCDPELKCSNRRKALFSRMYKNEVNDENICQRYVEVFETSQNPFTFFKKVEIWTSLNTVSMTRLFLRSKNAEWAVMKDPYDEKPVEEAENYETYTLKREDGWILKVMVDDTRCCLLKFFVVKE